MSEAVLALAIVAGLACPVHMWWQHRRGRQASCCPPQPGAEAGLDLEGLRARQAQLSARIAELERSTRREPLVAALRPISTRLREQPRKGM